jgi:hypothetical protein
VDAAGTIERKFVGWTVGALKMSGEKLRVEEA